MVSNESLILVIEDQPDHRKSLIEILSFHGYRTLEAADGATGIRTLQEESPELVLLDLKLPDMDGLEVLRWVRSNMPEVPVVLISGYGTVAAAVEATKLGAVDFLEKPLRAERVLL
ncbi:MAG TPA: response regulator, partial [Bacteroidetes bacterium]|nr:response regulator [Bacteroidota bacterium]